MSNPIKRNLLLLLAAIVLVTLVIFLPDRNQNQVVKSVSLPPVNAKIDRVDFKRATNQYQINLVDGSWQLGTEGFPVLKDKVAKLLGSIEKPRSAEVVSEANIYEPFGLGDDQNLKIIFYNESQIVKTLIIGNSANQFNTFYGREDDDPIVYQIALERHDLDYPEQDLLDKKIFDFSVAQAIELTLGDKGKAPLVLKRPSENLVTDNTNSTPPERNWTDGKGKVYPKEKINDILNYVSILNASQIKAPEKKYQNYKMVSDSRGADDMTLRTINIGLENGTKVAIAIMEKHAGDYYVIVDGKKFHYLIAEVDGTRLLADPK